MNLQERIELIGRLGNYLNENGPEWQQAKLEAWQKNSWFRPEFTDNATHNILYNFLKEPLLNEWAAHYYLDDNITPKNVGIVMAGNIPMVGFHDFLCVFISGHHQTIKLSAKDDVLLKHLIKKLYSMNIEIQNRVSIAEMLTGCDAYIATGSNNSARYFEKYFGKYAHIIRRNKTSVALLDGTETKEELEALADDIHFYFGLGCRNVTKLFVPAGYDFLPLLQSFNKYSYFKDDHKYRNNYDYQLAIMLLGKIYYMTNESTLLVENTALFSAVSVVHYEYYDDKNIVVESLEKNPALQCIAGKGFIPFGDTQSPELFSYADGVDTMKFLLSL